MTSQRKPAAPAVISEALGRAHALMNVAAHDAAMAADVLRRAVRVISKLPRDARKASEFASMVANARVRAADAERVALVACEALAHLERTHKGEPA